MSAAAIFFTLLIASGCGDNVKPGTGDTPDAGAGPDGAVVPVFSCPDPDTRTITCAATQAFADSRAHWLRAGVIAWPQGTSGATFELYHGDCGMALENGSITGAAGSLALAEDPAGLAQDVADQYPHLAGYRALTLDAGDLATVPALLRGQVIVAEKDDTGAVIYATRVQIPGVLDDLYTYDGQLGAVTENGDTSFHLWAPTARWVCVHVYDGTSLAPVGSADMTVDQRGVWHATEPQGQDYYGHYYRYEVYTYSPDSDDYPSASERMVTDPYSLGLAEHSRYSLIVDLDDPATMPEGWTGVVKPALAAPEDIVLYEAHIRDFSISDATVEAGHRGTYLAFTYDGQDGAPLSDGMRHLQALQAAGLTHLHVLPAFDIATVNEDPSQRVELGSTFDALCAANASIPAAECTAYAGQTIEAVLETLDPSTGDAQRIVGYMRDLDGFNWGYDPFHYTAPEGSYATDASGVTRIVEFRTMVQALARNDLRVVMDVVYNHTNASGRGDKSVLDKIVPGYYHRLNQDSGAIERSTCCENTASEHAMMEKLMLDSLLTWARYYKVDAFRFDLMGHHSRANMQKIKNALAGLTMAEDGVDGSAIYLYGEGWNFGEVANNYRFEQATQLQLGGLGIGTFSDRLRDAVRGGGPFDSQGALRQNQGFISGNYYDPNEYNAGSQSELDSLLLQSDQIRVGLAGNLRDFVLTDRDDNVVLGSDVCYGSAPAGYTDDPQEVITYIGKHDNQTLWDISQYKLPTGTDMETRVRVQNLGNSIVLMGQGVPFIHLGQDMLRSKSMERDSYDSGDWYNRVDFTYQSNNWNVGLPREDKDGNNWPVIAPIIADASIDPMASHITRAAEHMREMLAIRKSSKLFRLETRDQVLTRVMFHNTGTGQIPGLIVMAITDGACAGTDLDPNLDAIVVVINASDTDQQFFMAGATGFELHAVLQNSSDPIVRTAAFSDVMAEFSVPARTTAVFVQAQSGAQGTGLACNALVPTGGGCNSLQADVYVRGTMNGWTAPPEARMVQDANDPRLYTVDMMLAADDYFFKIADETWGVHNFGITNGTVTPDGGPETMYPGSGDIALPIAVTGTYRFILNTQDLNQPTVEVQSVP